MPDCSLCLKTCVEFGYFQTSDSASQPFGNEFPLSLSTQMCIDIFGLQGPNVNYTNEYYGAAF